MAEAVNNGNGSYLPRLPHEDADLFQLLESHRLITLVFEIQRSLSFRMISHHAFENADRAVRRAQHLPCNRLGIDRFAGNLIALAGTADQVKPPLTGGNIATSSP